MFTFPASAGEKLGFDVLRVRLENYTCSRLGQDCLAAWQPSSRLEVVREALQRVEEMQAALQFDDPVPFQDVLDVREMLSRALPVGAILAGEDFAALALVLATMRLLHSYFDTRSQKFPGLGGVVQSLTPLPKLESHINGVIDEQGEVHDHASTALRRIRRAVVRKQQELRDSVQSALRHAVGQGYATEDQPTIRNGRLVIPIRAEAKRKVQGFIQDTSASGQTVYVEPASCLDLNNEVRVLELEEQREVRRLLQELTGSVRDQAHLLRDNLDVLGQLDLIQAKARLSNELEAMVPDLNTEGVIRIKSGRNPRLLLHFQKQSDDRERTVVPLDMDLGDSYHTLVITGPNAGGKSVAMKTVGLFALMLAHGLPIPVKTGSNFALFDQLFVDIGDEQSIENDLSTFSSHLSNLRHMIEHADRNTLILIDEAGTGTDPEEGGALAQAVLEHLANVQARTIVTTHHGSLKAFAHETSGVENGSMQFDQATLSPTYRFQTGIPGSSYAFEVAARIGLPGPVLERSRLLVGHQKSKLENLIASLEARNQQLIEQLDETESIRTQAEASQEHYESEMRRWNEERDEVREKALTEARQLVKAANARIERTIREIKEAEAEKEATRAAREQLERFKTSVEQRHKAVKRKQKKRRRPSEKSDTKMARGALQVGDQVILDENGPSAEVAELEGKEAVITYGSMRARVKLDRLTKVGGPRKQKVSIRSPQKGRNALRSLHAQHSIDIRGQRVDEALQNVTQFLDQAVVAGLEHIQVLHGKGTGALRLAVQDLLRSSPDVSDFSEASPDQGGAGVTMISLVR